MPKYYSLSENIKKAIKCKNSHSICRIKVNFVVIKSINDSDEDVDKMINYLLEFKDDVIIKVSFLNYTKKCCENNLFSPNYKNVLKILNKLNSVGFKCYLFETEYNTELGYGQLVQNYISKDAMSRKLCKS